MFNMCEPSRCVPNRRTTASRLVLFLAIAACLMLGNSQAAEKAQKKVEYKPGTKYLIIHADDAGMSHSVNNATIDSMEKGIVSSASIMVPCPWFPEIANYASKHPEQDFGLHLTLNSEWKNYKWGPVAGADKVPSLVDEKGHLWSNVQEVYQHAQARDVETELRAQIDRALEFGIPVTHLDTHMGAVIARYEFLEIYVRLGLEYKLPVMFTKSFSKAAQVQYAGLRDNPDGLVTLRKSMERDQLPLLDSIMQFYGGTTKEDRHKAYMRSLRSVKPGVSQLIIHCGYDNEELQAITSSHWRRDHDREFFMDPEVIAEVKKLGIVLISWKQFHEMNQAIVADSAAASE